MKHAFSTGRKADRKSPLFSMLEQLESRQLMSTVMQVAQLPPPNYYVDGTEGNDVINVSYVNTPYTGRRLTIQRNAEPASYVFLTNQNVVIRGLGGNDVIRFSGSQNVEIQGGAGNDSIFGGVGNDMLYGNDGDDLIDGGAGSDAIYGGAGTDLADYSARTASVNISLDQSANDGEFGENDNIMNDTEGAKGGAGNDFFTGNSGNNVFYGGAGNDFFHGGAGQDFVRGGDGDDVIYGDNGYYDDLGGDAGNDSIYGSSGPDMLRGGDGDDLIISIGGTQCDSIWGDGGMDSFWTDAETSEIIFDASAAESVRNVHRVAKFDTLKIDGVDHGTPSRELLGQSFDDPSLPKPEFTFQRFSNVPLFNAGGPVEDDVQQGAGGDCYFMAPLSGMAKNAPNVIKQSVVELGDGTYAVEFRRDGQAHFIRVDADLPANSKGHLVYAQWRNQQPEMWVPIMEKAYAVFRGGQGTYANLDEGYESDVYDALGISSSDFSPFQAKLTPVTLGQRLQELLASGATITAGTDNGGILEDSHVYLVDHVNVVNGNVVSIILRNPWGTDGHGGDANDNGYVAITPEQAMFAFGEFTYVKA